MKSILQKDLWSITSFLKNKEYNFNKENILTQLPEKFIDEAILAISSWDNYAPTPLIKLNKLNDELKFKNIYYKDEDKRFELKSFKALGGAFAVYKIASEKKDITVSTATAGNHGRSVAWGAQRLGLKCKIFISEFVSESRAEAMRNLDAEVIRVKGNYAEYGGAPLLGLNGVAIVCHGSSRDDAIVFALRYAKWAADCGYVEKVKRKIMELK